MDRPVRPRERLVAGAVTLLLLVALPPLPALAQQADRIDLPAGWRPEGVTTDGSNLYVGSLADGAIWKADPVSGEGAVLVPGAEGQVAVGVEYDPSGERIWVAGGDTGQVRAYSATSGELLGTWQFEAGFINDLVATEHGVFATDSFVPQLLEIPFGDEGALPELEAGRAIDLSGAIAYVDGFNVNGIVAAPGWLIVVQSGTGLIFRVDPASGRTAVIDTEGIVLTAGDGLELAGRRLYVVRNQASTITLLELAPWLASAQLVGEITSEALDIPATGALIGDHLWVANARFGRPAGPDTEYWLTRLDVPAD